MTIPLFNPAIQDETVTRTRHVERQVRGVPTSDGAGHQGLLENGGVQWMTAGRGVIHSEIPQQEEGRMEGFQLWLNLPGRDKLSAPWYRDFASADLPHLVTDRGVAVTVIAGSSHGVAGAVTRVPTAPL